MSVKIVRKTTDNQVDSSETKMKRTVVLPAFLGEGGRERAQMSDSARQVVCAHVLELVDADYTPSAKPRTP